jgi:hypothetical protein
MELVAWIALAIPSRLNQFPQDTPNIFDDLGRILLGHKERFRLRPKQYGWHRWVETKETPAQF